MWNSDGMGGHGGDSGGGYMNSPGYGSSQPASQMKSNQRVHSNLPCTIGQIISAEVVDDNFVCNGMTLNQVTLIGVVRSAKESATNIAYELDDHSGPLLEVRQFVDNDTDSPEERVIAVRENVYVRVHGHVRSFGGKRSVVAFKVRPISDLNELSSHLLELVYVRAYHRKSQSVDARAGTSAAGRPGPMGQAGAYGNPADMQSRMDSGLNDQQQRVLNVLRTCDDDTGISIQKVCEQLKSIPQRVVRESIDFLSSEGHIFSTIDDDHYRATDAC